MTRADGHRMVPGCWVMCTSSLPLGQWNAPPSKRRPFCALFPMNCHMPCLPAQLAALLVARAPQAAFCRRVGGRCCSGNTQAWSELLAPGRSLRCLQESPVRYTLSYLFPSLLFFFFFLQQWDMSYLLLNGAIISISPTSYLLQDFFLTHGKLSG